MFKKLALVTILAAAPAAMASANCVREQVANASVGWVRGQPDLHGTELWQLTAGSEVIYCGHYEVDGERIWHWISFRSAQEPWEHEGWMSSRILELANVAPQSTQPQAPAWADLVDAALRYKNAQSGRVCQPEFKTCTDYIDFAGADGVNRALRSERNAAGDVLLREVCEFNETSDVRKCIDFDTHNSHRSMKDSSTGEWIAIDD